MPGYAASSPRAGAGSEAAGLVRRTAAAFIDAVIMTTVYAFVCTIVLVLAPGAPLRSLKAGRLVPSPWVLVLLAVVGFFVYLLVPALFHTWRGQTPGKMLAGIQVVDESGEFPSLGRCLLRELGYHLGNVVLFLSAIWAFFDAREQGLHDKLAHTLVVKAGRYYGVAAAPAHRPALAGFPRGELPSGGLAYGETQVAGAARGRPVAAKGRDLADASLVVLEGPERGREFRLYRGDVRIGRRREGNDVALAGDPTLSREHALIREEHGYFTLFDRGSATGTLVNGHRVGQPVLLEHGDQITMGNTKLRFVKLS